MKGLSLYEYYYDFFFTVPMQRILRNGARGSKKEKEGKEKEEGSQVHGPLRGREEESAARKLRSVSFVKEDREFAAVALSTCLPPSRSIPPRFFFLVPSFLSTSVCTQVGQLRGCECRRILACLPAACILARTYLPTIYWHVP